MLNCYAGNGRGHYSSLTSLLLFFQKRQADWEPNGCKIFLALLRDPVVFWWVGCGGVLAKLWILFWFFKSMRFRHFGLIV